MTDITDDIRAGLETKLAAISGLPTIAWENVSFEPTTDQSYIKPRFIPTLREPSVRGLNPQQKYLGIFLIECYSPEGEGPAAANAIAKTIVEEFEATTDINTADCDIHIRFTERNQGQIEGAHYMVSVNVSWQTFK